MSTFTKPSDAPQGSGARITDYEDKVLVLEVCGYETGIETEYGEADAGVFRLWVCGDEDAPQGDEIWAFQAAFSGMARRSAVGSVYCGRLGKGEKKPGKSAPWILMDVDDATEAKAAEWWTAHPAPAAAASPFEKNDSEGGDKAADPFADEAF